MTPSSSVGLSTSPKRQTTLGPFGGSDSNSPSALRLTPCWSVVGMGPSSPNIVLQTKAINFKNEGGLALSLNSPVHRLQCTGRRRAKTLKHITRPHYNY